MNQANEMQDQPEHGDENHSRYSQHSSMDVVHLSSDSEEESILNWSVSTPVDPCGRVQMGAVLIFSQIHNENQPLGRDDIGTNTDENSLVELGLGIE